MAVAWSARSSTWSGSESRHLTVVRPYAEALAAGARSLNTRLEGGRHASWAEILNLMADVPRTLRL